MIKMDFNEVVDFVTEKAKSGADAISSRFEDIAEAMRLSDEIAAVELEIDQCYMEAGKKSVAARSSLVAPEIQRIDRLMLKHTEIQKKLEEMAAKKTKQEEETEPKRAKYCSECGAKVKAGAKFCPDCGTKLV